METTSSLRAEYTSTFLSVSNVVMDGQTLLTKWYIMIHVMSGFTLNVHIYKEPQRAIGFVLTAFD